MSNSVAAYNIAELPQLEERNICRLYDITDKQREKISFKIGIETPEIIGRGDCDDKETVAQPMGINIDLPGLGLCTPFMTESGVFFVQRAFLMPLSDIPESELMYFCREDSSGQLNLAVKVGLFLCAVVVPIEVSEDTVEDIRTLYHAAKLTCERQRAFAFRAGDEQALEDMCEVTG